MMRSARCGCRRVASFALRVGVMLSLVTVPLSAPLSAQTQDDGGLWFMWFGQGTFAGFDSDLSRMRWWLDVQPRWRDEGEQLDTVLIRPGLGYSLNDQLSVWAGYAWIVVDPLGRDESSEHRTWQQVLWTLPVEGWTLQSRTRLEQRFVETADDTGWRLRQFVKAAIPLTRERSIYASLYDEVFFDLDDTGWGHRRGLRQNRAFAGVGWYFDESRRFAAEVGYLNQWIDRRGEDRLNHLLSVNLFMSF